MKLIYADAAIHVLKELTANGTNKGMIRGQDAVHRIEMLSPAQPNIIYCKYCKLRDENGCCKHWKGLSMSVIPIATDDYGFCSSAKRREE